MAGGGEEGEKTLYRIQLRIVEREEKVLFRQEGREKVQRGIVGSDILISYVAVSLRSCQIKDSIFVRPFVHPPVRPPTLS